MQLGLEINEFITFSSLNFNFHAKLVYKFKLAKNLHQNAF